MATREGGREGDNSDMNDMHHHSNDEIQVCRKRSVDLGTTITLSVSVL